MTGISWSSVAVGAGPFLLVLILKLLIDFRLAPFAVKLLFWLPVRNYFRAKPIALGGAWEHIWGRGGSSGFEKDVDRHGHPKLRQLGSYIYAEFYSQQKLYAFFGEIKHGYVVGDWYDVRDPAGYFGVFHLEIVNSNVMRGLWLGHSKSERTIRHDTTSWTRIDG